MKSLKIWKRTCPEATETTTDAERPSPPREAGDAERRDRDGLRPCDSILAADVEDATDLERRLWFLLRLRRALDRERERSTELARPTPELGKAPESGTAIPVPEPGKAPGLEVGLLWEPTTLVKAGLVQAGLTSTNPGGAAAAGITPAGTGPPYTGPGATGKAFEPTLVGNCPAGMLVGGAWPVKWNPGGTGIPAPTMPTGVWQ